MGIARVEREVIVLFYFIKLHENFHFFSALFVFVFFFLFRFSAAKGSGPDANG